MKKQDPKIVDKIFQLRNTRMTHAAIGKALNLTANTVQHHLNGF